ncbi:MAG: UDP-N-acetylmuramate--L-alanine ligase [Bacteroidales bacterium]|nr:UDP-N-acetylmuramate--L-alanine ligase [Bacteroidales bacterium]
MTNKRIYFLGIGGIGMSALAQYFLAEGDSIYGYDLTPSPITDMLTTKGAVIHFDDNCAHIPENVDFVVYTPAVPRTNAEFQYFIQKGTPMYKRSQVLGHITEKMPAIAVAGTHGKTTTTSMVCHLLAPEVSIAGFIGGIAKNFDDNLVLGEHPVMAVAEADEFDRSFLTLHPAVAVITSMDADHLDIYGSREQLVEAFAQYARQSRTLVVEEQVAGEIVHPDKRVYGLLPEADYQAYNITLKPNRATFDLHTPDGILQGLQLRANGIYNVLNATAAIAAIMEEAKQNPTLRAAASVDAISGKLQTFAGVKRRFDYIIERDDLIFIDDYAHHPQEMRSFITAVRGIYPDKRICGVFQPHLYSRTRDFAPQFAEVLALLDDIILLPIYPAREKPIPGITSEWLLSLIRHPSKRVLPKEELLPYLQAHRPDVLLTIGAGDIDRLVKPLGEGL